MQPIPSPQRIGAPTPGGRLALLAQAERELRVVADELFTSAAPVRVQPAATLPVCELVRRLGPDSARYAVLRRPRNPQGRLDLACWRRATVANPAFAVRFAHARLLRAARFASERRAAAAADAQPVTPASAVATVCASDPRLPDVLMTLRRLVGQYPLIVQRGAARGQPHRLTSYLESLAAAVTELLTLAPEPFVPPREVAVSADSGAVAVDAAESAQQAAHVLRSGLHVLGVSAPEQL